MISTHKKRAALRILMTNSWFDGRRKRVAPSTKEAPPHRVKEAWSEPTKIKREWCHNPGWTRGKCKVKPIKSQEEEDRVAQVEQGVNEARVTRQGREPRLSFVLPNAVEEETDSFLGI